jgi:hypothetical protein
MCSTTPGTSACAADVGSFAAVGHDRGPSMERLRQFAHVHATAIAAALSVVAVVALAAWQAAVRLRTSQPSDPLFVTACLTVIAGLWLARGQHLRLETMIARLVDRGALDGNRDDIFRPQAVVHDHAERWAWRGGVITAVGIALAFVSVYSVKGELHFATASGGIVVGAAAGFLVGRVLGRMLAYGLTPARLLAGHVGLRATAGHIDGAAGLKPLGDFYLYQALLVAIPAAFLLVWSLLFLLPRWSTHYHYWRAVYLGLLPVAIGLEVGAFAVPLARVHQLMSAQKREQLTRADTTLSRQIAAARRELEGDLPNERRTEVRDQLEQLVASYRDVETMPNCPVDRSVRRRLTLGNIVLIVPLVSQLAALVGR